jgi:hypothetical protein
MPSRGNITFTNKESLMSQNIVNTTEINQVTNSIISELATAFEDGYQRSDKVVADLPSHKEIVDAARKMLKQESKSYSIRESACDHFDSQLINSGVPQSKTHPRDCPICPGFEFSEDGGRAFARGELEVYLGETDNDLEAGLRKCMYNQYYNWFRLEYYGGK